MTKHLEGQWIGPYHLDSRIGAGGMGEVYKARDTKLDRDVAIKVLKDNHLVRFKREAQVLASLNHPNIGHIYGFEDSPSTGSGQAAVHALVLELVPGPTLADRIAGGPLALADAWPIVTQIALALEAAHEQGIVHRDLKPANIKVRPDGVVKVLDFGLAKALEPAVVSGAESASAPTRTSPAQITGRGVILGTAAYMSPEQARGQAVDTRTDIWAFGCVLYETLTGRIAFKGDTVSDTLVSILDREPAWDELPAATPASVRALLQRCLEKDPKRRLRDIADARLEIEQLLGGSGGGAAVRRARQSRPAYRAGLGVVALVVLAAGAGLFYLTKPSGPVTSPSEYTQLTDLPDSPVAPALSPDGRMVTFIRGGEFFYSTGQIYVKLLPNGDPVRLTNDADGKFAPVFTPDGSRIAYSSVHVTAVSEEWDTWTVPVQGGQPTRLLPNATGLTWLDEHRVLFSELMTGTPEHMGIVTATDTRAEEREIYFPPHVSGMAHYAYASPDRKSALVVEMNQSHTFNQPCRLLPLDGSSAGRQVGPQGTCTSTAWSPDGKWMYFGARVAGTAHLWRQKFPDGRPEQITFGPIEEEGVTLAPDGRSLVTSVGNRRSGVWIHDAAGERAISSEGYALAPRLSRDSTRVFYLLARDLVAWYFGWRPASAELRVLDLASGKTDSVLPGVSVADYEVSRDEKDVAFTTMDGSGEFHIWLAPLDRRTPPREIAHGGDTVSFGAAGDLVFRSLEGARNFLVRIKKDGTGREHLAATPILDKFAMSPDGEWALVTDAGAGQAAIVGMTAVPIHGGAPRGLCIDCDAAAWSPDGKFLYLAVKGRTVAIPVPPGQMLPDLPKSGISLAEIERLPETRVIEHGAVSPGPDPSTYVFVKTDLRRNLFRIPLH